MSLPTRPCRLKNVMHKLDRTVSKLTTLADEIDDGYMAGSPEERISAVWDITVALWSISTKGAIHAESRLQRDVAVLRETQG